MWLICCKDQAGRSVERPNQQNIMGIGQFTVVHRFNDRVVRKIPSDTSDIYSVRAVEIEAQVYRHLGRHKRIARCLRCSEDYVDLRYEANGDLESYLRDYCASDSFRHRMARQAIEAVIFIHAKGVTHSDLSARQFLVDKHCNARLSDFGGSSLQGSDAIIIENATHFLPRDEDAPNTVQSDLFALGSTIYEILAGHKPYGGLEGKKIPQLYSTKRFPSLDEIKDVSWRTVVLKCWMTRYKSASDIRKDIPSLLSRILVWRGSHPAKGILESATPICERASH
ncbi:kinase-like domain-containing protein [Aspergillus bertholletiae]|uniref:Kinase-like domain-containing protein n=1 Tax=Aspergillus bertholletiae TaxID=1226010 RepID=A0A5N7BKG4_9EURO|nr:kinase-like domain-containing protein [Aspergillus bertholletiae]